MKMIVLILLAIVATGMPARAEDNNPLVGTWRLVSFERQNVDTKAVSQGFGGNAMGFVTYTADGRRMPNASHPPRLTLPTMKRSTCIAP
jgi:hypothetical protein